MSIYSENASHVFRLREIEKSAFSNVYGLKSVFEKLRFRGGLVWTVGRSSVEIKLRFQISLGSCGRCMPKARIGKRQALPRDVGLESFIHNNSATRINWNTNFLKHKTRGRKQQYH